MSKKNIYEIFDEFKEAKNKAERIDILKKNDSPTLRNVLIGTFHPGIKYTIKKIPEYKIEPIPAGMAYSNMTDALNRIYLFVENNPRTPAALTEKRKEEILIQILESLEEKEAQVFIGILKREQNIPYLTSGLIDEVFPGILPKPKTA
jgi:hypothetical protein